MSHLSHIQLLFTGGIPLSLLMLHRVADGPSLRRGVGSGVALAAQALSCAYYGIFAGLMVGYGVAAAGGDAAAVAIRRLLDRDRRRRSHALACSSCLLHSVPSRAEGERVLPGQSRTRRGGPRGARDYMVVGNSRARVAAGDGA